VSSVEVYQVLGEALTANTISASEYMRLFFAQFSYSKAQQPQEVEDILTDLFFLAEDYVESPELRRVGDMTEQQFVAAVTEGTARLIEVSRGSVVAEVGVQAREDRPLVARGVGIVLEAALSRGMGNREAAVLVRAFLDVFVYPPRVRRALEAVSNRLDVGIGEGERELLLVAAKTRVASMSEQPAGERLN
jgi:hypothetical protein